MNFENYRLLAPGPVPMPKEVYDLLARPIIHHRTPLFESILDEVFENLKIVFGTTQPVFMQSASGSGVMESAVVNTLSPGDKVLVINSGKFGERWTKICKQFELEVIELKVAWGKSVAADQLKPLLDQNSDVKAVLTQASETSTGALHDIKAIAELTKNLETLLIVDGITAVGTMSLPMDNWGIDVLVAGSQKAMMLPPGLGFISLSEKAWRFQKNAKLKSFYWNLEEEMKSNMKGQTRFTSAVSHIIALDWVLKSFLKEGLEERYQRLSKLAKGFRLALTELGFKVFPEHPSPSLSAFTVPQGSDGQVIRDHLEKKYEITIAGGQDELKGKVIRVGHMGDIKTDDVLRLTKDLGATLIDLGVSTNTEVAIKNITQFFETR